MWQEVDGMISDSLAPGIVIRAPDKTSARESGGEVNVRRIPAPFDTPVLSNSSNVLKAACFTVTYASGASFQRLT